jgi:hypothetical protein
MQTFQRMMDCTVNILEAVFAYMDNSGVGSPDRQTHFIHLLTIFSALAANGLAINFKKCLFAVPTLEILSHTISAAGSSPTTEHTAAIDSCPPLSEYQAVAKISLHGELLLPFPSWLCPRSADLN